jgi:hypothetical protein
LIFYIIPGSHSPYYTYIPYSIVYIALTLLYISIYNRTS